MTISSTVLLEYDSKHCILSQMAEDASYAVAIFDWTGFYVDVRDTCQAH